MKRKRAQAAVLRDNVINFDPRFDRRNDDRFELKKKRVQIYPKNLSQETYLLKLTDPQKMIIFAIGPAGTGKTMLAVQHGINQLKNGEVEKIIITRPAVSVDEQHGFLPGDLNQKMEPWTKPIMDVFAENYHAKEIENMIREGVIEVSPLAYMRGRTFKNAVVIADEMQNATPSQMKMLLTRLGTGSKMVVTGDLQQADRPNNNGLLEFLQLYNDFKNHRYVDVCHFTVGDIERHEAVKEILAIYKES
jgi:phosphate starvation-inducible protein PhoH and related proteins